MFTRKKEKQHKGNIETGIEYNYQEGWKKDSYGKILNKYQKAKWARYEAIIYHMKVIFFLDPYLALLYPVYSLVSSMTNPHVNYGKCVPKSVSFTVDVTFIPEGEDDSVQVLRFRFFFHKLMHYL